MSRAAQASFFFFFFRLFHMMNRVSAFNTQSFHKKKYAPCEDPD